MSPRRLLFLVALGAVGAPSLSGAEPLRVLILSGANNHNWRSTTPALKSVLEEGGAFAITVTENVASLLPRDLAGVSVVLSNYNEFGRKGALSAWGEEMRAAFIAWIRRGHGFVTVHAGSSVFYDWPEFQALAGTSWGKGTHHGKIHENTVQIVPSAHPITAGVAGFTTRDEYWEGCVLAPGAVVLATVTPQAAFGGSGRAEPIALTTTLGAGRGFTLLLGHDVVAMNHAGFKVLLRRGTAWAATGPVAVTQTPRIPK
jgi:type 1 glutamine amidotransferase